MGALVPRQCPPAGERVRSRHGDARVEKRQDEGRTTVPLMNSLDAMTAVIQFGLALTLPWRRVAPRGVDIDIFLQLTSGYAS